MGLRKKLILLISLGLVVLPSYANFEGKIAKNHFYDCEKTIMSENVFDKTLTTGKYWEKNLFYANKYRPLFMLSNKELYDLMPKESISIVQRISTPSIYNISLKTATINKVSITQIPKRQIEPNKNVQLQKQTTPKKVMAKQPLEKQPLYDLQAKSLYEGAKGSDVDSEKKIDTAVLLKNSKNTYNYTLAINLLDEVTKQEPYNAYAFYLKGEIYSGKKDPQNAMKNYIEALKINPCSKQCCIGIAKILEPTNKTLAQRYYERAELVLNDNK